MEEFFSFFYRINFYGEQLYYHLRGWDDAAQGFLPALDKFPMLFCITAGTAFLCFLSYYYIFNHPRSNRWYFWIIPLILCITVGFLSGFITVRNDIYAGIIAQSLMNYIGMGNAILFGIYNGLLGGLIFFILTLIFRMWSKNCKHSPWPLLITKLNNKGKQDHE